MNTSEKIRKKNIITKTKKKFLTYAKTIKFLLYVDFQIKTVLSMITKKKFGIRAELAKICNNVLKLNQIGV